MDAAKELISEAIADKLDLKILGFDDTLKPFKIADLGCSVGPNTLLAVQNIIEAVELEFQRTTNLHQKPSALEFQVFLNDHSDNDFNTLFKSLPHARKYFAAGVPGSFHSRLFPRSSIHFVHTSNALHWLSKVPKEIVDPCSPAWNKGSIQCSESNIEVVRAYSTQYKNDMESFLNARAEELVPGGLMVLILAAVVPDGIPMSNSYVGVFNNILGSCFNDLAKMVRINDCQMEVDTVKGTHVQTQHMYTHDLVKFAAHFVKREMRMTLSFPVEIIFTTQVRPYKFVIAHIVMVFKH